MSRDYKASARRGKRGGNGSSMLAGILIGLILGLGIALGLAWYINKMPSPFPAKSSAPPAPASRNEGSKAASAQTTAKNDEKSGRPDDKLKGGDDAKPRFDFYKILPGEEGDRQKGDEKKSTAPAPRESFFLQAGAFQNAPDADNLKARLALLGVEASIETSAVPDKGIWHRVRLGPYTSVEELNRVRETLKQNGVQTTLVKQRDSER